MVNLVEEGKVRAIALSNFDVPPAHALQTIRHVDSLDSDELDAGDRDAHVCIDDMPLSST